MREFHIKAAMRHRLGIDAELFSLKGPIVFANLRAARDLTRAYQGQKADLPPSGRPAEVRAEDFYAMGLIDEILHYIISVYRMELRPRLLSEVLEACEAGLGRDQVRTCLLEFTREFPPRSVYLKESGAEDFLNSSLGGDSGWEIALEELLLLWLENMNLAYGIAGDLFDDRDLEKKTVYSKLISLVRSSCETLPAFGPENQTLVDFLRAPAIAHPDSLQKQLEYIRDRWGYLLGDKFLRLLRGIDYLNEVNQFSANMGRTWGPPQAQIMDYSGLEEYEGFTPDKDWMPKVVLMAKSTLVWLDQLSRTYKREIRTLDQIPDQELDLLAARGFNALWLIGLWERSDASRKIKHSCGNPEAAASAYSISDYLISQDLGGWQALENLNSRCTARGIRLASDMVPNHTGMDSAWVQEHPDRFMQLPYPPFPSYSFNGENLSSREGVGIYLEDHYYDRTDAAVVFKRVDFASGESRYIYHGNDGTHMPWNDTAQLDFLNPETREAVIQTILQVAKTFSIIRFDAAMTLAKKHIQRLWYPEPGRAGDIPSRADHSLSSLEFHQAIPQEFWREVVDRAAQEAPDTLLLAEAFWMMEGYFVRTLGMHRVYNSAFMNMLKNEENSQYRQTIKNTLEFDKDILKRFVNFMNNPDEETAVTQFGKGDKYFGVATMMVTMPGLPMFGHGQIEGFSEKYGMEYQRAYLQEEADPELIRRHEREIFPLMKKRSLFAEVQNFQLYDLWHEGGWVNENVFAYSNANELERAMVLFNNSYDHAWGYIKESVGFVEKSGNGDKNFHRLSLAQAMHLRNEDGYFALFWDQRSELWFIRPSREIHERGLFVDLPGYACQVFLNIHEIEDNRAGHYRILCDRLQGRGVRDLSQAIRDIILDPVYSAFRRFYSAEYRRRFLDFLESPSDQDMELSWFEKAMHSFLEEIQEFLSDPGVIPLALRNFRKQLQRLASLREALGAKGLEKERAYLETRAFQTESLLLSAFVILDSLGEEANEWYLEGKIQEITSQPIQITRLFRWLRAYEDWGKEELPSTALGLALENYALVEFIDAHYYDGVMWFRKEAFEDFAWWACLYEFLIRDPEAASIKTVFRRSQQWLELMGKSSYRLESLLNLASPAAKPAHKAKSTSSRKTGKPAEKTSTKYRSGIKTPKEAKGKEVPGKKKAEGQKAKARAESGKKKAEDQ